MEVEGSAGQPGVQGGVTASLMKSEGRDEER